MANNLPDLEAGLVPGNGIVKVVRIDGIGQQKRLCFRRAPPLTEDFLPPKEKSFESEDFFPIKVPAATKAASVANAAA